MLINTLDAENDLKIKQFFFFIAQDSVSTSLFNNFKIFIEFNCVRVFFFWFGMSLLYIQFYIHHEFVYSVFRILIKTVKLKHKNCDHYYFGRKERYHALDT